MVYHASARCADLVKHSFHVVLGQLFTIVLVAEELDDVLGVNEADVRFVEVVDVLTNDWNCPTMFKLFGALRFRRRGAADGVRPG